MSGAKGDSHGGSDAAEQLKRLNQQRRASLLKEFALFIVHERKWWMIPILLVLLLIGALVMLAGSGAGPFIYPFF